MKEFIDRLSLGVADYTLPVIKSSVSAINCDINSGTKSRGEIRLFSGNSIPIKGVAYSSHEKFKLTNPAFIGLEAVIEYEIDGSFLCNGEEISGSIEVVSNGGEITIPFVVKIEPVCAKTSIGDVKNLFHFANLVQTSYDEAIKLFVSKNFSHIFLKDDLYLESVYEGLLGSVNTNLAMEEFLIAANKKRPVSISISDKLKKYEELTEDYGDAIVISKGNWGYTDITVEALGDFLYGYKRHITSNDFAGSNYEFQYLINVARLHEGKNVGSFTFITGLEKNTITIEVIAPSTLTREKLDYQRYIDKLFRLYIDFRLKRIDADKWADVSYALLDRIRGIKDDVYFYKLYQAHVAISKGDDAEGAWLLENVAENLLEKRMDNMEMYCYYLYVRTLQKRDSDFTDEVIKKVMDYYENGYDSWILLWILFYLDDSYDNNLSLKITRIKEQYNNGMRSPILYYEAINIFNEQPELLRILNDFEIQVLCFGSKESIISEKLANQIADVSISVKQFNVLLFRVLTTIFLDTENKNVLTAIVSLLIKGNKMDSSHFFWYDTAIQMEIKLTGLYEYYLYSLPEDYNKPLPQIVLMYFSYNNNLGADKQAVLFKNVIKNKGSIGQIYDSYEKQMSWFVAQSIANGDIDSNIAIVYKEVLKTAMVTPEMAATLPGIINTWKIKCENPDMKQVILVHKEMNTQEKVPIVNGVAYIKAYTSEPAVIFVDIYGNRYCKSIAFTMKKLLDMEDYLKLCYEITAEDVGLTLYFGDKYIQFHNSPEKSIGILTYISRLECIRESYRVSVQKEIINYYTKDYDGDEVDDFLRNVEVESFETPQRRQVIELMIVRGIYDRAYKHMERYGFSFIEPRRVLKCLNKLIVDRDFAEDRLLIQLAVYVFRNHKYNENILKYLALYYYGATAEMYKIWKECSNYEIEIREYDEKLIAQMLFTRTYLNKTASVYSLYAQLGATSKIRKAYLFSRSYDYFVRESIIEEDVFDIISVELESQNVLPDLCLIAFAKYCSETESINANKMLQCKSIVKYLCDKDKVFGFFKNFEKFFKIPSSVKEKTFVEYRTDPNKHVYIHYIIDMGDHEETEYIVTEMRSIVGGVFVKDFVLFYGEKLNYYITEELGSKVNVTESKSAIPEGEGLKGDNSRYGMLNDMMICAEIGEEDTLTNLAMQYMALEELNESIFTVM